jgi:hypothetical protein
MCQLAHPLYSLPLVIIDETVENDVTVPSCFAEILVYLLLNGRRDEARAIAILIIIGMAMLADEALTHVWLHPFGHVVIKDVHHTLGILHLLHLAEKGTVGCAYILKTGIDTGISTSGVRHLLTPPDSAGNVPSMDNCLRNKRYSHFWLFL